MENIHILITTYQRPVMLKNLLEQIKQYDSDYNIRITVLNDKSSSAYDEVVSHAEKLFGSRLTFIRYDVHFGKKNYWRIVRDGFEMFAAHKADYYIQLPDDISLIPDFFNQAITTFNSINKNRICLNLLNDGRANTNWSAFDAIAYSDNLNRTGWVDMCYIANDVFFDAVGWTIDPIPDSWFSNSNRSSGVGAQLSRKIIAAGLCFYQVRKSLVYHGTHDSKMNFFERKQNPLITNVYLDKVSVGLASMYARKRDLEIVIQNLLPQVDHIYVYLNDYPEIPKYLNSPKITIYNAPAGDLGDAGKYYNAANVSGYYLTVDDDICYPLDYVKKLIAGIEKYNRKHICTFHGRIFSTLPVASYYHGHTDAVRCFDLLLDDKQVHVGGTGVMGYHTSTIKVKIQDFKRSNMADVWMAKIAAEQKVPITALAHSERWINDGLYYDKRETIYHFSHNADTHQTKVLNKIKFICQ